MTSYQKPIGILGGTFDPVHSGHLRMAIELHEQFDLDKVHLIPSHEPVHRKGPTASPENRLAMLTTAVASEPVLLADAREIERKGPSFTIDTLEAMRNDMPQTPLCLLMGMDAFIGIPTWHRYQDILRVAHIIIANRPPYSLPTSGPLADLIKAHFQSEMQYIHHHLAGGLYLATVTALDISASDIRKLIAMKRNPRYLLPDSVYKYIQQYGIYNQ